MLSSFRNYFLLFLTDLGSGKDHFNPIIKYTYLNLGFILGTDRYVSELLLLLEIALQISNEKPGVFTRAGFHFGVQTSIFCFLDT